jgi:hypothetical protein
MIKHLAAKDLKAGKAFAVLALTGASFSLIASHSNTGKKEHGQELSGGTLASLVQPASFHQVSTPPKAAAELEFAPIKRDSDFFKKKEVLDFCSAAIAKRTAIDDKVVEKILAPIAKKWPIVEGAAVISEGPTLGKFDSYVESWLLKQPPAQKRDALTQTAYGIADAAFRTNSQDVLARKAFALIALGEKDAAGDEFALQMLSSLYYKGSKEAALSLVKVGLYSSDNDFAKKAIQTLADNDTEAAQLVLKARDDFGAIRDIAVQKGQSPLVVAAFEKERSIAEIATNKLPVLIEAVRGHRVAANQKKLDADWAELEKEVREAFEKGSRRVKIDEENEHIVCVDHTAVWGVRGGKRNVDIIPVGARITGVRANHNDEIFGIQFLYEAGGKKGETPWRGSKKGKINAEIALDPDEVIKEFEVKGFEGVMTLIKLITNKRVHIICDVRVVEEDAIKAVHKGGSIKGNVEFGAMGLPIAIGLVTYSDNSIKSFGLVRQWNAEGNMEIEASKEDFSRNYPTVPELK